MPTAAPTPPAAESPAPVVDEPTAAAAAAVVTAVVVTHDGARWLPGLEAALAAQTRPPDLVVAADTGRTEAGSPLTSWVAENRVVRCPPSTGFGAAVRAALDVGSGSSDPIDWIWLLHDDCAPEPGALLALLRAAERDASAGVLGPKVRALGADQTVLLEVGVTIARSGRRETLLERRERDQGQHDGTRRVLAVGTAGLLVRRDIWDELDGLDPRLPLLRDDVDLGWRATLAGHRVLCVTDAVVLHAEAASHRRRAVDVGHRLHRLDRQHATYVLLANLPLLLLPVALVTLTVGSLLRSLGYLVGKLPRHAADELGALLAVIGRPGRLVGARRRRRRTRRVPSRTALSLLAPRSAGLRHLMETAALVAGTSTGDVAGGRHRGRPARGTAAPSTGPTSEEDEDLPSWGTSLVRRLVLPPSVGLVVAMVLVTLLAARGLLGEGRLMGGALLPAPDTASALWRSYVTAWHPVGIGSDAVAPPYLAVLAALATVLGGPEHAVDLVLLGAVPLAAATGYLAARRLVGSVPVRVWAAATYALLPPTLGAVAAGRLGTAVLAVLLPLIGLTVTTALALDTPGDGAERGGRGRATAAGVLMLAVATAFVPLVAVLALAAGVASLAVVRGSGLLRLAALVLAPLVLLLPWLPAFVDDPQLLLLEAGLPGPGLSDQLPDPVGVLLLRAGGPGAVPLLLTVPLLLVALAALLRGPGGRRPVVTGWAVALLGLAAALVQGRLDVTAPTLETSVPAWPGAALLMAGVGLLMAAAAGSDGARARVADSSFGWRQPTAAGLAVLAGLLPVAVAGWWVVAGAGDPLDRRDPVLLPAFVAAEGDAPDRPRTLVLRPRAGGDLAYALLRAEGPRTGDAEVAPRAEATRGSLDLVVADLASGRGGDAAARLVPYGIRYVLLTKPADPALARAVDAVPGVVRVSGAAGTVLWKVDYPTGRLRVLPAGAPVVDSDGAPPPARVLPAGQVRARTDLPAGSGNRLLVLADPQDDGWRARVDGRELVARRYDGWAQAFEVPAASGRLELRHEQGPRTVLLWVQLVATVVVAVLALPQVRTREDDDLVGDDEEDAR